MHVAIVALNRFSKPTGLCRHAVNLARCLADTDKVTKITLITGTWQTPYFKKLFNISSPKINLESVAIKNSSLSRNAWFLLGLPKLVKTFNPDLVHLSFPIPFFRSLFDSTVIASIHDLYPYDCPENFGYPNVLFNRLFLKQCIKNSDCLSCVSKVTLNKLKYYFPSLSNKADVVYNYVDFSEVISYAPPNINIDAYFLLCIAQHRKNKNLAILIKSYSLLINNSQLPNKSKLIIVGSFGSETANIRQLITELSLQNHVLLLSSINDNQLAWLYENCQLAIFPSYQEGFCLPLIEAHYFSSKVVCSDIPIFREVGSSTCTYFELHTNPIENLATSIIDSLKQPRNNINFNYYQFSKSNTAKQYLKLYQGIVSE